MVKYDEKGNSSFKNIDLWKKSNINIFDGTKSKLREQYPIDVNECRLFQYESCRGLEGWAVVCFQFDELLKYKKEHYCDDGKNSFALESKKEKLLNYLWMWTMMPFTRAIDTLVITLKNTQSEIGGILRKVAEKYPDFVSWEID